MMKSYNFLKYTSLMIFLIISWGECQTTNKIKNEIPLLSGGQLQANQPVHIRNADTLKWVNQSGKSVAVLSGKVDIFLEKDQITITADTVWYYSESKIFKAAGHVKTIKIDEVNGKIVATSQRAEYAQLKKQITLSGNAKVVRGDDELLGDPLVITIGPDGTTLEGVGVSGTLTPQSKQTSQ